MGVYIDMEMPKEGFVEILICDDGTVQQTGQSYRIDGTDYYTPYVGEMPVMYKAVPVPPHGRLIDADGISEHKYATIPPYRKEYADGKPKSEDEIIAFKFGWNNAIDAIAENAPTIIPASEEGES